APVASVASTVMSGCAASDGGLVSVTCTANEAEPVLPAASVAVQTTVVVPSGKALPELWSQPALTGPPLSVAETSKETAAPASTVRSAGTVTTGGVVSCTVTRWVAVAEFPDRSVAVYVIVVAPIGKALPFGTPLRTIVTGPPASIALAAPRSETITVAD